jgi:hypothetical protein
VVEFGDDGEVKSKWGRHERGCERVHESDDICALLRCTLLEQQDNLGWCGRFERNGFGESVELSG